MSIDYSQMITPEAKAAAARQAMRDVIAARRYKAESAGIIVSGMAVATDRESQALITGAALAATIDPAYTCNWKTPAGFVTLDAQTLLALAVAIRKHVQACFDREAELLALLEVGDLTPAQLDSGWPA